MIPVRFGAHGSDSQEDEKDSMAYKRFTKSVEQLAPDTRYSSLLVAKFINCMMYDGKKSTATRVVYDALDIIAKRIKDKSPLEVFEEAVENCRPNIEVRSKRVGGSNYQVPIAVNRKRQQSLAFRWIRDACRNARKSSSGRLKVYPNVLLSFLNLDSCFCVDETIGYRLTEYSS